MVNFVERWGKERPLHTRLLIQNVTQPEFDWSTSSEEQTDLWDVQVFRSITSDSAR